MVSHAQCAAGMGLLLAATLKDCLSPLTVCFRCAIKALQEVHPEVKVGMACELHLAWLPRLPPPTLCQPHARTYVLV